MESPAQPANRRLQIRSPGTDRPYICDFVCRERAIVVEVDGGQHAESKRDESRDRFLRGQSYLVMRFWNNDVLSNIDGVLQVIEQALHES